MGEVPNRPTDPERLLIDSAGTTDPSSPSPFDSPAGGTLMRCWITPLAIFLFAYIAVGCSRTQPNSDIENLRAANEALKNELKHARDGSEALKNQGPAEQ